MALLLISSVFSSLVIALLSSRWYRVRRALAHYRNIIQEHGCGEPRYLKDKLPWGLDRYYKAMQVLRREGDIMEELFTPEFEQAGYTYRGQDLSGAYFTTTAEPENVQAILALRFKDYRLGPDRVKFAGNILGYGIFTADGEDWEHFRAQMRPQFSRAQISDLEAMERHVQQLFEALPTDASGWTSSVDLSPLFHCYTMDVATEFLFGISVDSQRESIRDAVGPSDGEPPRQSSSKRGNGNNEISSETGFAEAMKYAFNHLEDSVRLDRLFGWGTRKSYETARNIIHGFADNIVRQVLDHAPAKDDTHPTGKRKFVLAEALAAEIKDPIELRSQLLHVLVAGRDTTASLFCWLFLVITTEHESTAKLRHEVLSVFGPEGSDEEITIEKLKGVRYLQYYINETLRLYPLVPLNYRIANEDTILPVGGGPDGRQPMPVLKGELVLYSPYHMHRRKDIWGEDADQFRPERWENKKSGWFFLPFHGGPRICLGQQFALTEASFVVVRILQRFDAIEGLGGSEKFRKASGTVMTPMNGVSVRLHRAGASSSIEK